MPSEIQVDSNSIQSVLIILITVAIGCYLFYELRKLKQSIENLNKDIHIIKTKLNLNQIPQKNIINPNLVNPNLVNLLYCTKSKIAHKRVPKLYKKKAYMC